MDSLLPYIIGVPILLLGTIWIDKLIRTLYTKLTGKRIKGVWSVMLWREISGAINEILESVIKK